MVKRRRNKYGVDISNNGKKARTLNGITYDSLSEMRFVTEWILPKVKNKEIKSWERQIPYLLQDGFVDYNGKKNLPIKYIADFKIMWSDNSETVIDIKGLPDAVAKIKKKLLMYKYRDMDYRWYCRNIKRGGWLLYEDLEKTKREEKKSQKS